MIKALKVTLIVLDTLRLDKILAKNKTVFLTPFIGSLINPSLYFKTCQIIHGFHHLLLNPISTKISTLYYFIMKILKALHKYLKY